MSEKLRNFEHKINDAFSSIKLDENETKCTISVTCVVNKLTKEVTILQVVKGNKIDITEALIKLMREERRLEIHDIAEAVREFV